MPQLITIGETMAAFTPDSVGALRYVQNFGIRTAGAESNVAVGLAKLGLEAAWVSRLGTDEFGCFIRNQLRAEGVDCSRVIYDPDHRTGIMFKETGVGETKVFYYRENSAASHLCPEDVTPALLEGVKILHMSGITPVLSESCLAMTKAAFALAKEQGVAISFDPNIRRKLWKGQDYAPLIRDLTLQSQIVLLGLAGNAFTMQAFLSGALLSAVPGIVLQLVLIPAVMVALDRTGVVRFQRAEG